jgi:DNA-binding MarR family transcriptional regulator
MSRKQKRIVAYLARAVEAPTLDELVCLFGHTSSKQAMRSTLRYLEDDGLVEQHYETRDGRRRLVTRLTADGTRLGLGLPL